MALTEVLETKLIITKKCNYNNFLRVPLGKILLVTVHRLLSNFQSVPHYTVSNMLFLTLDVWKDKHEWKGFYLSTIFGVIFPFHCADEAFLSTATDCTLVWSK